MTEVHLKLAHGWQNLPREKFLKEGARYVLYEKSNAGKAFIVCQTRHQK